MEFIISARELLNTALAGSSGLDAHGGEALWWLLAQIAAPIWVGILLADLFSIALQRFKTPNPRRRIEPLPPMAFVEPHIPHLPDPPDLVDLSDLRDHVAPPLPRNGFQAATSLHELEFLFELLDARENAPFLATDNGFAPDNNQPVDEQEQLGNEVEDLEASQESLLSIATASEPATSDDEINEPETHGEPTIAHDAPRTVAEGWWLPGLHVSYSPS
ncbi:hypothetical protein B0T19DRAFT_436464 [Cercophora scortea]|uniref:Uncharacterized protein n=1 Tax=Cercophora scortea TaxID=314031 RepID=A0AAE0ML25_9PEZI|nr:hypothetical protein B0T19DRAFT_436464 [Cercophora scortea]